MSKEKAVKEKKSSFLSQLFRKKPLGAVGLVLLVMFVLVAVFADVLAPYPMVNGNMQVDILQSLKPSSPDHLLGTDSLGRDVLSYLIYGARTSVVLAVSASVLSTLLSLVIGVSSAVIGGKFDLVVQRFVDAWQCVPGILILLILMSIMGSGTLQLIIALALPAGVAGSRIIRSAAISVKDAGYVKMSGILGGGSLWKMIRHVIPNIMPTILMGMAGLLAGAVMMEASMNFLGYGVNPGTPSWGYMITDQGRTYMYLAPWLAVYPGILISILVFSAAMFGDAVRDILDPRLKGGVGSYSSKKIAKMAEKLNKKFSIG